MLPGTVSSIGPMFGNLLGRPPSFPALRPRFLVFVRAFRRYYAVAPLPAAVYAGLIAHRLLLPARSLAAGNREGLPVLAHGVSLHAWGLRLRGAVPHSRCRAARCCPPCCLTPSAPRNTRFRSSIPSLQIPLSNASSAASRLPSHGSGPWWFATPCRFIPALSRHRVSGPPYYSVTIPVTKQTRRSPIRGS
jgi:hypothetical protein